MTSQLHLANQCVPEAEKPALVLGYLRLTDCAPLVIAKELGFFSDFKLDVTLRQEVSWASVRDKLAAGTLDAAQMLAPLPAMAAYGVSGMRVPLITGLVLSLNGNAITLAHGLWQRMIDDVGILQNAQSAAQALRRQITRRNSATLTFGVVHSFSTHSMLLRSWLRGGGIDPDRDVSTIVVPPSQMADSLASGAIDGYCVGEPWNTAAVLQGTGAIAAAGCEIWTNAPEKVLCVLDSWHNQHPNTHLRLRLALMRACAWLADPDHIEQACQLLAHSDYLRLPLDYIRPSLTGKLSFATGQTPRNIPDFHVFSTDLAGFPWHSNFEYMISRCAELLGSSIAPETIRALAEQTGRTDLFREAAGLLEMPLPESNHLPDAEHALELEPRVRVRPSAIR